MYKFIFFTLTGLLFTFQTIAQKALIEFDRDSKGFQSTYAYPLNDGGIIYIVASSNIAYIKHVSNEMKIINTSHIMFGTDVSLPTFVGSSQVGEELTIYYAEEKKTSFKLLSLNLNLKTLISKKNETVLFEGYKLLKSYPKNGKYYFVTMNQKKGDLVIYECLGTTPEKYQFSINNTNPFNKIDKTGFKAEDQLNVNNNNFMNTFLFGDPRWSFMQKTETGFQFMKTDEYIDIKDIRGSKKYYHLDNKIYLTFDGKNKTKIFQMDLEAKAAVVKEFFNKDKVIYSSEWGTERNKTSSIILGDKLFQFYANYTTGFLRVFDLSSTQLEKEFSMDRKQEVTFKNTPIIQEDFGTNIWTGGTQKELAKTSQLLRKVANNYPVIAVNYDVDGNYIVELGSLRSYNYNMYYDWHWHNNMFNQPMQMNQFQKINVPSFPKGPAPVDMENIVLEDVFKLATFKTVLSNKDFSHIKGKVKEQEKFNYTENLQRVVDNIAYYYKFIATYKYKSHYHFWGLEKKSKKYKVFELKE